MIDVLIAGAGPTGLMLAALLKRQGMSYRIIDQNVGPAKESRALGVQARTLELFHKLGIVDKVLKRGTKASGAMLYLKGEKKLQIDMADMERADTLFPYIYFLPQSETEAILLEEGIKVERNTKLVTFSDKRSFIEANVLNPQGDHEKITARFICGCDGAHSVVRKILNLEFKGDSYTSTFLMADAKVEWQHEHDRVQIFLESGRAGVFFPLQEEELSRIIAIAPENENEEATLEEVEKLFNQASHQNAKLTDPKWVTKFKVHHRSVGLMRVDNAFLLGDAAHIHSPIGAQGMNTGLQDANNLAWKLKLAKDNPDIADEILESYHSERHPIAVKLLKYTDRLFSMVVSKNNSFIRMRNFLIPYISDSVMKFPFSKKFLFKFISQLNIHYHDSLVAQNTGERAPNGMIEVGTLHDLMKGYEFVLLAFKDAGFREDEKRMLVSKARGLRIKKVYFLRLNPDDDNISIRVAKELFDSFKVDEEGLFLIRPDGHVGFKTDDLTEDIHYPVFMPSKSNRLSSFSSNLAR